MEKNQLHLFVILLTLATSAIFAQDSKFYHINDNKIKTESITNVQETISIENSEENISKVNSAISVIAVKAIPILIKNAFRIFYNPKNYIKEYGKGLSFIKNKLNVTYLDDKDSIIYRRKGNNSKKDSVTITELAFKLNDILNLDGFKTISFHSYQFNHTNVKLRDKHKLINAVVEVSFVYYDKQNQRRDLKLNPIKINNIIPGETSTVQKENIQIIPPLNFIESLQIKITEVNKRKKDWDKWLKRYNDYNDKLSDYLVEVVQ